MLRLIEHICLMEPRRDPASGARVERARIGAGTRVFAFILALVIGIGIVNGVSSRDWSSVTLLPALWLFIYPVLTGRDPIAPIPDESEGPDRVG